MPLSLLAHQGGWDEFAMVLVPLAFLAWLLRIAHVRAGRLDDAQAPDAARIDGEES